MSYKWTGSDWHYGRASTRRSNWRPLSEIIHDHLEEEEEKRRRRYRSRGARWLAVAILFLILPLAPMNPEIANRMIMLASTQVRKVEDR